MNLETLYKEPRIYAFTLESRPGWIKVGYTDRQTVAERVKQETQVLNVHYKIEVDEKAQTDDGRMFDDNAVATDSLCVAEGSSDWFEAYCCC